MSLFSHVTPSTRNAVDQSTGRPWRTAILTGQQIRRAACAMDRFRGTKIRLFRRPRRGLSVLNCGSALVNPL